MSKTYNEALTSAKPRGFNTKGQETPAGAWNTRVYLRQVVGMYWEIDLPGSRTLSLEGTGAIVIRWGKGFPLQVKYLEQHYTTVFTDIGRYDLIIKGDVHLITKFSNAGYPSLRGSVKGIKNMESLITLELEGGGFTGELDVSACPLVTLTIPESLIAGNFDLLPASLMHIDLRGATGLTGDLSNMYRFAGLRYLDVTGTSLTYDINAPSTLPAWADGIHLGLADLSLTVEQLLLLVTKLVDSSIQEGYLDMSGNNAAFPTEYMELIDGLRQSGWTVYCNEAIPAPGQPWHGGILAYLYQAGDAGYVAGELHGIVITPTDAPDKPWSNITNAFAGATQMATGQGNANTDAIIAQAGHTNSPAQYCHDYVSPDGYSDFCLPTPEDWVKINTNTTAIGGFTSSIYWTSAEPEDNGYSLFETAYAIYLSSEDGYPPAIEQERKEYDYNFRAIRYF